MVDMFNADSKRMYSWWWDSHVSPNNSKWVQQNLSNMDAKVKQMIEIIEEDADSFAQRAETYYKKRPELMNLVEEFYRSYRALAERYDHATGLIRHVHHNLVESFPNQVHPVMKIDLPTESEKDACNNFYDIKSSDDDISRKGVNELFDETEEEINVENGRYEEEEEVLSEWERLNKVEAEILGLKKGVERLESEKEGGLLFENEEERLCNIESGVYDVRESCEGVEERASKGETEVEKMKEVITKLYAQKEAASVKYQHCFHKINNLENNISSLHKINNLQLKPLL